MVWGRTSVGGGLVFRRGLLFVSVGLSPRSFGCLSTNEASVLAWEPWNVSLVCPMSTLGASGPVALESLV